MPAECGRLLQHIVILKGNIEGQPEIRESFTRRMTMKLVRCFLHHHYKSDFDVFIVILKRLKEAFEWHKNHQNPIHIDGVDGIKFIPSSFDGFDVRRAFDFLIKDLQKYHSKIASIKCQQARLDFV